MLLTAKELDPARRLSELVEIREELNLDDNVDLAADSMNRVVYG
jgi:hypothetical protein